jgi:hypothetical protein
MTKTAAVVSFPALVAPDRLDTVSGVTVPWSRTKEDVSLRG